MIRIASWYESSLGRNDGNPLYVTAFLKRSQFYIDQMLNLNMNTSLANYFPSKKKDDLEAKDFAAWFLDTFKTGYRIDHLRPVYGGEYGEYDLNLWIDWGEDGLTGVLGYEPEWPKQAPIVYWASDTHLGYDYRLMRAKQSDLVFCAQKKGSEDFKKDGVDATWLPHCFDPQAYPRYELASKKYDICFVGHVNSENRMNALDNLFKEFPNFYYGQKRFEACSRKYAETRVAFNIAMKDDLNMRCFEVMGSGSLLLTDKVYGMDKLFEEGFHYIGYTNIDEAIKKAKKYIKNEDERIKIADQGFKEVSNNHTIGKRVKKMFEMVKERNLIKGDKHASVRI